MRSEIGFLPWFIQTLKNVLWVLRKGNSAGRFAMCRTYLRIELKRMIRGSLPGHAVEEETLWGRRLRFTRYATFAVSFQEVYLTDVYRFQATGPRPLIVDCGANMGMAVSYFLRLYPECRIVAFEPDPVSYKLLEANRRINGWENVTIHNCAVHKKEGSIPFYSPAEPPGALVSSVRPDMSGAPVPMTHVPAVPLSRYIEDEIDLLKIDVEGSEEAVLEDLVESGKIARIQRMILEYHHHVQPDEDRLGRFLSLLEQSGFGYQIRAQTALPWKPGAPGFFMIFAYRK